MNNCIFCKIINKNIPCYKIYEDENVLAFLDISKDVDGHTLVIPKKHFKNVLDCDEENLKNTMCAIKKIMKHYQTLGYEGFNIINSNELVGEQSVFHLHFHIYPRKAGDGYKIFPHLNLSGKSLEEMCDLLKLN